MDLWTYPKTLKYYGLIFFKDFIYLFLEKGEGREKERETSMCGCLSCTPNWGPGPQPRHVPCLGIELATLWFTGWHWATPARALFKCFSSFLKKYFRERWREGEKKREEHPYLAHNPTLFAEGELNQLPLGLQAGAPSTEPHQPRQWFLMFYLFFSIMSQHRWSVLVCASVTWYSFGFSGLFII